MKICLKILIKLHSFSVIRDQDGGIYLRELNGCLLGGGYEPVAKPLVDDERVLGICKLELLRGL